MSAELPPYNRPRKQRKRRAVIREPEPPEHAWERQPNESDDNWRAFVVYRDLGINHRSHSVVAREMGRAVPAINNVGRDWEWRKRVAAYDAWVDRQTKLAEIEAVKDMRKRHVQLAMTFQGAAALALNKIVAAEKTNTALVLKPSEVRDLVELGTKLERLNRGEPESIVEERQVANAESSAPRLTHDYAKLSVEELRALRALVGKAKADRK